MLNKVKTLEDIDRLISNGDERIVIEGWANVEAENYLNKKGYDVQKAIYNNGKDAFAEPLFYTHCSKRKLIVKSCWNIFKGIC